MPNSLSYTDRFGHSWRVQASRASGGWSYVFVNQTVRLITAEPVSSDPTSLSDDDVKNLFCDAERVLESDTETWYVGYRQRAFGARGRVQGNLCTRFRSESGEIRFAREMLDFRHMSADALLEHLEDARASGGRAARSK